MMRGHMVVDCVGEDAVVAVEEEDTDKGKHAHSGELEDAANLQRCQTGRHLRLWSRLGKLTILRAMMPRGYESTEMYGVGYIEASWYGAAGIFLS